MTGDALATLSRARRLGVAVEIRGGRLWAGPADRLSDDLLADLRRNKADVLRALKLLAPREQSDTAPAPPHVLTPEQLEAELARFPRVAVPYADGSGFVDPEALHDPATRAALGGGGFRLTSEWIGRARAGLALVRENEP